MGIRRSFHLLPMAVEEQDDRLVRMEELDAQYGYEAGKMPL